MSATSERRNSKLAKPPVKLACLAWYVPSLWHRRRVFRNMGPWLYYVSCLILHFQTFPPKINGQREIRGDSSTLLGTPHAPQLLTSRSSRASRIRCDGEEVCTNCANKNKVCTYTKSNRGGPRVSRKKGAQTFQQQDVPSISKLPTPPREYDQLPQPEFEPPDEGFWNLIPTMMLPGAGLREVDSDHIFDSIFGSKKQSSDSGTRQESIDVEMCCDFSQGPTHRTYSSNEAMYVSEFFF